MRILAIGDIVGVKAIEHLKKNLAQLKNELKIDFTIANGENATEIHGLSVNNARDILDCGVDFITMGNHTWSRRDLYNFLDDHPDKIIRPANYPGSSPGYGSWIINVCGYRLLCINVLGTAFMEPLSSPFDAVECVLASEQGKYDFSLLDIHAEATSEKYALARVFDGRINIIYGTHTHVQTSDLQILPGGSAYITDIGMTGPVDGILGTDTQAVLMKMRDHMPSRFTVAQGEIKIRGAVFDIDPNDGFKIKSLGLIDR